MIAQLQDLRRTFIERRHTALLVALVTLFAVRPLLGDTDATVIFFSLALMLLLLVAFYTITVDELQGEHRRVFGRWRRRRTAAWVLTSVALVERLLAILAPSPGVYVAGVICYLALFAFMSWSQLRSLLREKDVTGDTIAMSISVYLLLGLTWAMLYALILQLDPDAINLGTASTPTGSPHNLFQLCIYFSLTTLSTIGFGDITPVSMQARYAAVAEGITGQFYLATLVARLVGMHMSQSGGQGPDTQPRVRVQEP